MATDTYSKIVLSVIAVALLFIASRDLVLVPQARAQDSSERVVNVNIAQIDGRAFRAAQVDHVAPALPVEVK
jgi:hypothetical protein